MRPNATSALRSVDVPEEVWKSESITGSTAFGRCRINSSDAVVSKSANEGADAFGCQLLSRVTRA
jgi:hypothetical protein